jgi:phenol 2-monooxygenase
LTSSDLLQRDERSSTALTSICDEVLPTFPKDTIELVVVHPIRTRNFEWTDLPICLKKHAEMRFHGIGDQPVYQIYGVAEHEGAIVLVRPDGYVGAIVQLHKTDEVLDYLRECLVSSSW